MTTSATRYGATPAGQHPARSVQSNVELPRGYAITPAASGTLDMIRAVAAAVVMIGHVRGLFFVPYGESQHHGLLTQVIYLGTSLGHQAVMIFFVLSGLLVGRSVLVAVRQGRWSWHQYLIRRLSRLYIVLIPALCLTALWDLGGAHFFGSSGVYTGLTADRAILPPSVLSQDTFGTFLGNASFLMTVVVPVFGSNGPLWSLANEFWYYLLFPIGLLALSGASRTVSRVVAACSLVALPAFLPRAMVLLFPT